MQCNQCGHMLDDSSRFCNQCGAAVQNPEDDRNESIQMDDPATIDETPVIPVNKKSKKNILLGIAAAALLVAVVLVLCFSPLRYWIVRTFTDPADLLVDAYTDGIHSLFTLSNYAEKIKGAAESDDAKGTKTEMHIKLADDILNSLSESMFGSSQDMSWMSDIALTVQTSAKENLMKTDLELWLAEHSLLTAEAIVDSQSKNLWLTVPELQNQSLTAVLDDVATDAYAPAMISGVRVPDEMAEKLLVRYAELFLMGFSQVEKSKQDITAGTITRSVTVLKASMSEKDCYNALISICNQAKEDQELKQVVTDIGIYDDFIDSIDNAVTYLQQSLKTADSESYLYLSTYLNNTNHIAGFEITNSEDSDKISAAVITRKKQFAADICFSTVRIEGSGTLGKQTESEWQIKKNDVVVMDMEVTAALQKKGNISGQLHLKPGSGLAEELFGIASGAEVDIALSANPQQADVDLTVKNNGQALFSIGCTTSVTEAEEFTIPQNAVDMADEEALSTWAMGIDPTKLINALTEAGLSIEMLLGSMMGV